MFRRTALHSTSRSTTWNVLRTVGNYLPVNTAQHPQKIWIWSNTAENLKLALATTSLAIQDVIIRWVSDISHSRYPLKLYRINRRFQSSGIRRRTEGYIGTTVSGGVCSSQLQKSLQKVICPLFRHAYWRQRRVCDMEISGYGLPVLAEGLDVVILRVLYV